MDFHITKEFNKKDKHYINNQLYEYNLEHFPEDLRGRYEEISLFLRDENGIVLGGILGEVCWNWLEIHTLMIDKDIRKQGFGTKLLLEIEQIAFEKN